MSESFRTASTAVALAVFVFATYLMNGREIGAGDTVPALFLPIAIVRGDGLVLNRYQRTWSGPGAPMPFDQVFFVATINGQVLSRYPLGAPLLTLPLTAPQVAWLDRTRPGWDTDPQTALLYARRIAKHAVALIAAATAALLYVVLRGVGLDFAALLAALITALGSNLWMTASQSPWQHTAAAFWLVAALALLMRDPASRTRLFLAGGACAALVCSRPSAMPLAAIIAAAVAWRYRRAAVWFVPLPVVLGALLVTYNVMHFGTMVGGYSQIFAYVSHRSHGVASYWTVNLADTALGTLVSPSHGLFVFTPWIPLTLATLPWCASPLRRHVVLCAAIAGLVPFAAMTLSLATWWGGWSFGPRYWTDVMPLFGVLLGFALQWSFSRARPIFAALLLTGAIAVAVQTVGAWCFPSSFDSVPGNIDLQHARLWSWRDGELARCIREGVHRPQGW